MAGFNNFKAFTGGVAEGLNNANALRDKERMELDMAKQKEMLSVDADNERAKAKISREAQDQTTANNLLNDSIKRHTTKSTQDALGAAQNPPPPVASVTTPNTPPVTPAQPAQATGTSAGGTTPNDQPPQASDAGTVPGGTNSTAGSAVSITGLQSQQSDNQTSAAPQVPSATDTSTTQNNTDSLSPDDVDWVRTRAKELANKSNMTIQSSNDADGFTSMAKMDLKVQKAVLANRDEKTALGVTGDNIDKLKASANGVPLTSDTKWFQRTADQQYKNEDQQIKQLFTKDRLQFLTSLPENDQDLKTLAKLNDAISTGNFKAVPGVADAAGATDQYNALFNKITSRLALVDRPQGIGARVTNMELTNFAKSFASLKVPNQANTAIIMDNLGRNQRAGDFANYQRAYLDVNKKYDDEADQHWIEYEKANPYIDNSNPMQPKFIPYTSYKAYFNGSNVKDANIMDDRFGVISNSGGQEQGQNNTIPMTKSKDGSVQYDFSGIK